MFAFLLIVQTLIAVALIGVILMQRSEGGGLGVGGSSSGFMTARGAADFLTRATSVLGGMFIVLSVVMAAIAGATREPTKIDTSLAWGRDKPVSLVSHGAVHFRYRRRGLIARQGSSVGVARGASSGARLQGPDPQVRPLSERRSGDDVALSARRGLCDRRRRRDRSRPRPLRTVHRSF